MNADDKKSARGGSGVEGKPTLSLVVSIADIRSVSRSEAIRA